MSGIYRIFGSELSPYSVKVRSFFRYKKIPHEWMIRSMDKMAEFQKYAKLPLIPCVVTPEGKGVQDSTQIIEQFEKEFPEPSIHPKDEALRFLSELLEEYADEWGNKPMFHYRWHYPADQESAARRIAMDQSGGMLKEGSPQLAAMAEMIKKRMVPRLKFVGSSDETAAQIEGSYKRQLEILEKHFAGGRKYLFGNRPALADFGCFAQLHQCGSDPTPGAILREKAPLTAAWVQRMLDPKNEGEFENWGSLGATLAPLLRDEVGGIFLPWSDANARALAAGEKEFSCEVRGKPFRQEVQKYHAKSLSVIRQKYAVVAGNRALEKILEDTGCLKWLRGA